MKYKQRQAQNQRILNITTTHLIVGIDIAQETHVARTVNYRGIELGRYLSFTNDGKGFEQLLRWIKNIQAQHSLDNIIIGMEPTGHYWLNLACWLVEKKIETVVVNPYSVKQNKENRDNSQTKNDIKDALVIADMVKNGYYAPVRLATGVHKSLRVIMTSRSFVLKHLLSVKNQIVRWIDIYFPEYRNVFKDVTCQTSLSILRIFPLPNDIKKATTEEIRQGLKKIAKRTVGQKRAQFIIEQARISIGDREAHEEAKLYLNQLLDQYAQLSAQLNELEEKALELLQEIPYAKQMQAIKGIGTVTVAGILAEGGDLSQYRHGNQILRHGGLHLCEDSSGKHKGQIVVSKRGRPQQRSYCTWQF
jgi:transposase